MIPIEDAVEDVLFKAASGMGLCLEDLASRSGLEESAVTALLAGDVSTPNIHPLAAVLKLDAEKLIAMDAGEWLPDSVDIQGLKRFNTPFPMKGYEAMTVNSYLVWDSKSNEGCVFDTGTNVHELLRYAQLKGIRITALLITHTHADHIAAYGDILDEIESLSVYAPELEPLEGAVSIQHGFELNLSSLTIEARLTNGHSPGGITYVVRGLECPLAIVGDAIFCLSMGGAKSSYQQALKNNREQILSLPQDTVLCPGHGPMTTVADELARNPFY